METTRCLTFDEYFSLPPEEYNKLEVVAMDGYACVVREVARDDS